MKHDELAQEQIDQYFAGECDIAEGETVRAYLDRHPSAAAYHRALVVGLRGTHVSDDLLREEGEASFAVVRARLTHAEPIRGQLPSLTPHDKHHDRHRSLFRRWTALRAPAVVMTAIALVVGFITYDVFGSARADLPQRVQRFATRSEQRAIVHLTDGTRITLAPQTTLRLTPRVATLSGEAYFDVVHHATVPFMVQTASVKTQVLGTAFDIAHYPLDTAVRVTVFDGKVLSGIRHRTVLSAGQQAYTTNGQTAVSPIVGPSHTAPWTTGHLEFRETPIPEVLTTLERWYGVQFRLADTSLARLHLTASLDYGSLDDLLTTLTTLLDVTPTIDRRGATPIITLQRRARAVTPVRHTVRDSLHSSTEIGR